ncbi:MAG: hypothetical protein JO019_01975 [Candidatus Kaiserbacteria bacterium]|nr:hypothetical protein [Candidatus Kaiserbacteria bacterium]
MLPYRDSRLTQIALVIFFVIVIGYAYFEARGLLFGPKINISSSLQETHDPYIVIHGRADRISSLAMNGKTIPVTESGDFEEPYLLAPGVNRIIFDATDRYGRSRQSVVQILYAPTSTPETLPVDIVATSTAQSTTTVAH